MKCNLLTNLCVKYTNQEFLISNEDGGCLGQKNCFTRSKCETDSILCKTCNDDYFPDNNG